MLHCGVMEVTVSIYKLNPKLFLDSPHHNRRQTQDFRVWNSQQSFSSASSFLPLLFLLTKARCILNLLTPLVQDNTKKPCSSKEHKFLCPAASFSGLADSLANIPRFTTLHYKQLDCKAAATESKNDTNKYRFKSV